jgi:hypothetical protein
MLAGASVVEAVMVRRQRGGDERDKLGLMENTARRRP